MKTSHSPIELKVKGALPGISERQIDEHFNVLYKGYVNKLNEIETKMETADRAEANGTFSLIGELKREECFATNAIALHEAYFNNLGGNGEVNGAILDLIKEDFGSFEKWADDFKAAGVAARGWVVLAYNWADAKLHNYSSDYHTQGIWGCTPILVLDVYEHAYMIDYGTARKKYLDVFMANIDWNYVNSVVEKLEIVAYRQKMCSTGVCK